MSVGRATIKAAWALFMRAGVPGEIGRWLSMVLKLPAMFLLGINTAYIKGYCVQVNMRYFFYMR